MGSRRWWGWLGAGVVVAVAATWAGVWALSPQGQSQTQAQVQVRARVYSSAQACLLTGPSGVEAAPDSVAWAGMEDASLQTKAKVSYLAVTGPATAANAAPFLGTLVVRQCGVIVAADAPERAAVIAGAAKFPGVQFLVAGTGADGPLGANVTVLPAGTRGLRSAVASAVANAVG